ncbi:MAG: hypothetical protein MHPSP_000089, partial [Paramarteilia canceri]
IENSSRISFKSSGKVGIFTITPSNSKSINILGEKTLKDLKIALEEYLLNEQLKCGLFISQDPKTFLSGADLKSIVNYTPSEIKELVNICQILFQTIRNSAKPFVAAVSGHCLGAGLELALACQYVISYDNSVTCYGLPEVKMGLVPSAGGLYRLPRKITSLKALGKILDSKTAHKLGIVDELIINPDSGADKIADSISYDYLLKKGIEHAEILHEREVRGLARTPYPKQDWYDYLSQSWLRLDIKERFRRYLYESILMDPLSRKTRNLLEAPNKVYELFLTSMEKGYEPFIEAERDIFTDLTQKKSTKNLIATFEAASDAKHPNKLTNPLDVNKVGIIGTGIMGSEIAALSAQVLNQTVLHDENDEILNKSKNKIYSILKNLHKGDNSKKIELEKIFSAIKFSPNQDHLKDCQLIIESISEDLDSKQQLFHQLEKITDKSTIIVSNTSSIKISEISKKSTRKENIAGMHFFNPVSHMKLIEIVKTPETSDKCIATCQDFALKHKKIPIVVNDSPGFFTTRVMAHFFDEYLKLICEGFSAKRLDDIMKNKGFKLGPGEIGDLIGYDTIHKVFTYLSSHFGSRMHETSRNFLKTMFENKFLGVKNNSGIYMPKEEDLKKNLPTSIKMLIRLVNPDFNQSFDDLKENPNFNQILPKPLNNIDNSIDDKYIEDRIMFRLLNECLLCLEEGVIDKAVDGDLAAVYGLGFPIHLGGPFRMLDSNLASYYIDFGQKLSQDFINIYEPCETLKKISKNDLIIYQMTNFLSK